MRMVKACLESGSLSNFININNKIHNYFKLFERLMHLYWKFAFTLPPRLKTFKFT